MWTIWTIIYPLYSKQRIMPASHCSFFYRPDALANAQSITSKQQQQQRPFNGLWSGTTRVGQFQKKHSPTHTHPDHRASFISFLHLQWSMASSLFNLHAWQSSRTTSFQVFFGLPLGLEPSTSCSIHFFTQSSSSRHLFATHDRTSAAYSAAIPMLCHLHLVSLSAPYLAVYLLVGENVQQLKKVKCHVFWILKKM